MMEHHGIGLVWLYGLYGVYIELEFQIGSMPIWNKCGSGARLETAVVAKGRMTP